ncbi:formamidopyrimidine-DNA glycosylase [Agromyces flavus]|uniref:DNA-(Apurinic or apyrimidinic site) lyase n=1 Tax=Agromyces flavus TaxID=589382 RepID=A0A1H1VZF8_9MICO|nr:DNA-formamidopyrimidine glycosylase family protein [Agromyces flavus]MCP2366048.1 formamidopyrimidine-DNA glycosylase [Agromyces flavus]GGI43895.1 formamidopyrimidine-DNA glycosylase [Agromyces flavus]SDS90163.1 DNA-(apurinic or apyrimidinic site) lyase [Agromyces flavus]
MPESPEVQILAEELDAALAGRTITDVDVIEFRVTKTRARPLTSLVGGKIARVTRHGKLIDLALDGEAGHLVVSLGRHGWARWADDGDDADDAGAATTAADEPPPPALVEITFDDGRTLLLTDAGDFVSLGGWIVDDPFEVPAVAKLGPDPAADEFSQADFDAATVGRRKQVKAVLQEQESLAGIGNAYSDEILHAAKVSPVGHAAALADDERERLYRVTVDEIRSAIDARRGIPIDKLKGAKVAAMRVHGLAGEPCPRCGDTIRDFTFGSTTAQYCPTCQTDGAVLPLREA